MGYEIKTERFEGPIEILLNLIERRKLQINEVSLAEITDDYINFISSIEGKSFIKMTHFIYVASTLALIKSKALLPNIEITDEENDDIENLKKRIEIFKVYIDISRSLKDVYSHRKMFFHQKTRKADITFNPSKEFNIKNIESSINNVVNDLPVIVEKKKEAYIRIAINIEDMMDSLSDRIHKSININFDDFIRDKVGNITNKKETKVYNIIGFLAMLELVRNGIINVIQNENFDKILLD